MWKNILRYLDVLKEVLRNKLEFGSLQNFNLYIGVIESFFKKEIGCGKSTSKVIMLKLKLLKLITIENHEYIYIFLEPQCWKQVSVKVKYKLL